MKTIIYAILYVIVTPFWWFVMQFDNVLSKLYMHISIKLMESRIVSNDKNENNSQGKKNLVTMMRLYRIIKSQDGRYFRGEVWSLRNGWIPI